MKDLTEEQDKTWGQPVYPDELPSAQLTTVHDENTLLVVRLSRLVKEGSNSLFDKCFSHTEIWE